MKDIEKLRIRDVAGGAVLAVKVVPGSSRDKIAGILGDSLKVAVSAAPEKGKANAAVAALLAESLGVSTRSVQLVSSPSNPHKEFQFAGMTAETLRQLLSRL